MKSRIWLLAGCGWLLATAGMFLQFLAEDSAWAIVPLLVAFAFPGVATLLIRQRPGNLIGWLLLSFGLGVPFSILTNTYGARTLPALALWFYWLDRWMWTFTLLPLVTILPLVFPTGRLPNRRWRWALWLTIGGMALAAFSTMSDPWLPTETNVENPTAVPALAPILDDLFLVGLLLLALGALAAVFSVVWRSRRAVGAERQQLKWFIAGATTSVLVLVASFTFSFMTLVPDEVLIVTNTVATLTLPLAVGVAILRYRLWDIDVIIRRTLTYSALTATLALIYAGSVVLLQSVFTTIGGRQSSIAVVLSTLAIAALFSPLRRRMQDAIDRRFYRSKYDAALTLAAFAHAARDEVELERLTAELLRVVQETMRPAQVSLWLKPATDEIVKRET